MQWTMSQPVVTNGTSRARPNPGTGLRTKKDFYFGAVSRILGSLGKARYYGEMTPRET